MGRAWEDHTVVHGMDGRDLAAQRLHAKGSHGVADIARDALDYASSVTKVSGWLTHPDVTLRFRQPVFPLIGFGEHPHG